MSLGRNILWNLGGFLWLTLLLILVTPYMLRHLGLDAFGVWAVLTASSGYLSAFDFGMGNALIRYLAAENDREDRRRFEAFLRTGVTLQLILGTLSGATLFLLAPMLAGRWLRIPGYLVEDAVTSFQLTALAVWLSFVGVAYSAVLSALHRFDILAARTMILVTVQYGLFVLVLHLEGGLRGIIWAYVTGTAAITAYLVIMARSLLPGIVVWPGWNSTAGRELLRFGRYKFVAQVSVTFLREFDRLAIAFLLPVSRVSFYAVPLRLSQRMTQIVEHIASPFYPAMSSGLAGGRREEVQFRYLIGVRIVAAVSFGMASILGGLAEPFLSLWLGPDFAREGTWVLRILLLAYAASALFTLPSVAADGAGRPGIPASFLALGALLHAPLVVLGVLKLGLPGAALGVLLGFLVALVGVPIMHARLPDLPPCRRTAAEMRGALWAGLVTGTAALLVTSTGFPGSGVLPFLITLVTTGLLYAGLLLAFRGLRFEDVRRLSAALQPA